MKAGDTIIYGNGDRVEIVNFPTINGMPGVQVNNPKALFASERFKWRDDVQQMLDLGLWELEPATQPNPRNKP